MLPCSRTWLLSLRLTVTASSLSNAEVRNSVHTPKKKELGRMRTTADLLLPELPPLVVGIRAN